jgi:hypothetical protein
VFVQVLHVDRRAPAGQERLAHETPRLAQFRDNLARSADWMLPATKVATMLAKFDGLWQAMTTPKKQKLLNLLIERIDYDGAIGQVTFTSIPLDLNRCLPSLYKLRRSQHDHEDLECEL